MANPSHSEVVEALAPSSGMAFGLTGAWAQLAQKIAALNLDTARAAIAESTELFLEAATQPFTFGMFRPELSDVIAQHITAYTQGLNEILHGAHNDIASEVQRQFATMTGQDPFQWCLMGRDFLPDYGGTLPHMRMAMAGWVSTCLPGAKPLPVETVEPGPGQRKPALLRAPANAEPGKATE